MVYLSIFLFSFLFFGCFAPALCVDVSLLVFGVYQHNYCAALACVYPNENIHNNNYYYYLLLCMCDREQIPIDR